jgi:hypothetical protein
MDNLAAAYYLKGDAWRTLLSTWGTRTVVLPPDAPVVTALRTLPDWQEMYADNQAVVFVKKTH